MNSTEQNDAQAIYERVRRPPKKRMRPPKQLHNHLRLQELINECCKNPNSDTSKRRSKKPEKKLKYYVE